MSLDALLYAAKYAAKAIAEDRTLSTVESKNKMETAQKLLIEAIRATDPDNYFNTGE